MKIGDTHSYNILTNKVMLHLVHSAVYVKYFSPTRIILVGSSCSLMCTHITQQTHSHTDKCIFKISK